VKVEIIVKGADKTETYIVMWTSSYSKYLHMYNGYNG